MKNASKNKDRQNMDKTCTDMNAVLAKLDKIIDMLHKLYKLEQDSVSWAKSLTEERSIDNEAKPMQQNNRRMQRKMTKAMQSK